MVNAIMFDWSENNDENGESIYDLTCPNSEHHNQYGSGWSTEYEATEDQNGNECEPYQGCQCCEDDSGYLAPMMNFLYPLDYEGFITNDKEKGEAIRIKIASETNCVLVENNKTGEWFLSLTGGGMDLSPSIAYAYYLAQKWLPLDLLQELKAGWCKDSLSSEHFEELKKVILEQLPTEKSRFEEKIQEWDKPSKEITQ